MALDDRNCRAGASAPSYRSGEKRALALTRHPVAERNALQRVAAVRHVVPVVRVLAGARRAIGGSGCRSGGGCVAWGGGWGGGGRRRGSGHGRGVHWHGHVTVICVRRFRRIIKQAPLRARRRSVTRRGTRRVTPAGAARHALSPVDMLIVGPHAPNSCLAEYCAGRAWSLWRGPQSKQPDASAAAAGFGPAALPAAIATSIYAGVRSLPTRSGGGSHARSGCSFHRAGVTRTAAASDVLCGCAPCRDVGVRAEGRRRGRGSRAAGPARVEHSCAGAAHVRAALARGARRMMTPLS